MAKVRAKPKVNSDLGTAVVDGANAVASAVVDGASAAANAVDSAVKPEKFMRNQRKAASQFFRSIGLIAPKESSEQKPVA